MFSKAFVFICASLKFALRRDYYLNRHAVLLGLFAGYIIGDAHKTKDASHPSRTRCGSIAVAGPLVASAGPPFLTDDPVPVDLGHFETYVFTQWDSMPDSGSAVSGPAVEFNWGFLPQLQFHVVTPFENATVPGMPNAFGFGVHGNRCEVPLRSRVAVAAADRILSDGRSRNRRRCRNLGNGQTWYRLPIWLQKSFDDNKWTVDAGGGVALNQAADQRNYGFGGLLLQRSLGRGSRSARRPLHKARPPPAPRRRRFTTSAATSTRQASSAFFSA